MRQSKKENHPKRDSLEPLYRRRDKALERVVALWETGQDVNDALDVPTLAHTAATFKFVGG
jgi:hypothetical protein